MTDFSPQPTDTDIDQLSAYLDDALEPAERATLEARLQAEPALRQTLDELRATVRLLQELPQLAPPRSFTLDTAALRPRNRWLPLVTWLRLGSAFAAVLLALTFTFRFNSVLAPTSMESAPMAAGAAQESAANSTGSQAAPTSAAAAADSAEMPAATSAPAEAAPQLMTGATMVSSNGDTLVAATEAPAANAAGAIQPTGVAAAVAESADQRQLTEPQTSSPDTAVLEPLPAEAPQQTAIEPLRLVQLSLAALVLLLAIASFVVSRRARR